jgi:hypothetical protein
MPAAPPPQPAAQPAVHAAPRVVAPVPPPPPAPLVIIKKNAGRQLSDLDFSSSLDSPSKVQRRPAPAWSAAPEFPDLVVTPTADDDLSAPPAVAFVPTPAVVPAPVAPPAAKEPAQNDHDLAAEIDKIEAEIEAENELPPQVSIEIDTDDDDEIVPPHPHPPVTQPITQLTPLSPTLHAVALDDIEEYSAPLHDDDEDIITRFNEAYGDPARSSGSKLWGLIVFVLGVALAGQALYLFREPLSRELPGLRPLLVAACARIGCAMPLPRDASLIKIQDDTLRADPGRPGHYVFFSSIHNLARFTQAWPHLELTLTNASGELLTRRVITPAEWVPAERLGSGLPPRGNQPVQIFMEVKQIEPRDYWIGAFYP